MLPEEDKLWRKELALAMYVNSQVRHVLCNISTLNCTDHFPLIHVPVRKARKKRLNRYLQNVGSLWEAPLWISDPPSAFCEWCTVKAPPLHSSFMPAIDMVECKKCKYLHVAMMAIHWSPYSERVFPAGNIVTIKRSLQRECRNSCPFLHKLKIQGLVCFSSFDDVYAASFSCIFIGLTGEGIILITLLLPALI